MRPRKLFITVGSTLAMLGCSTPPPEAKVATSEVTITSTTFNVGATARVCTAPAFTAVFDAIQEDLGRASPGFVFKVVTPDSGCTPADVAAGAVDIAITNASAPPELRRSVDERPFAASGIAIVANRSAITNGLTSLSFEEVRGIFGAKIDNWNELGGGNHRIFVFHRAEGAAERRAFMRFVPAASRAADAPMLASTDYVAKIESTPGAIGYVSLTELDSSSFVRTFSLRTSHGVVAPSAANVASGAYPLKTYVRVYTRGGTAATELVYDHVASDAFQDRLAAIRGLVPIREMKEIDPLVAPRRR